MTINEQLKIIVYVNSFRNTRQLKKYGSIVYTSKQDYYVVMYIDKNNYQQTEKSLAQLSVVRRVELSPLNQLVSTFSQTQAVDDDDEEI